MRSEVVHIALTFADDAVGAMQFVVAQYVGDEVEPQWTREPTPEAVEEEIAKAATPDPATGNVAFGKERVPIKRWRFCAADEFPQDRTFRDAWRDTGSAIVVDMPSARNIHRDNLRHARELKLAALDADYAKADEKGDAAAKADIGKRRQRLRDITKHPAIDAAQTPEQLKAATLDALSA